MFNVKAQSINHFTTKEDGDDEDPEMLSFAESCLKSFRKTIQPGMAHYTDLPTHYTGIYFTTQETSTSSSSSLSSSTEDTEEESIMVLPKNLVSVLEGKPFAGFHFAFLMTHPLYGKKTSANIAYSTNPMRDVHLHNILAMGDRTTSAAAPHWVLDIVLGPFISADKAIECTQDWVSHTRGKESKRKKAKFLSRIYGVPLYSASVKPEIPLRQYLQQNAPPSYMVKYEAILKSNSNRYSSSSSSSASGSSSTAQHNSRKKQRAKKKNLDLP